MATVVGVATVTHILSALGSPTLAHTTLLEHGFVHCARMAALNAAATTGDASARVRRWMAMRRVISVDDLAVKLKNHMVVVEQREQKKTQAVFEEVERARTHLTGTALQLDNVHSIASILLSMQGLKRLIEIKNMWGGAGGSGSLDTDPVPQSARCAAEAAADYPLHRTITRAVMLVPLPDLPFVVDTAKTQFEPQATHCVQNLCVLQTGCVRVI